MVDRVLVLALGGCAVFGTLLLFELTLADYNQPASTEDKQRAAVSGSVPIEGSPAARVQRPQIDELVATALGRPLFSATRKPQQQAIGDHPADEGLPNLRLTGIVIEPSRHLAIFAVPDGKPLVRSEGDTVDEWRLDSIEPRQVSLSGPSGITTLEPKADPHIIRPVPAALPGATPAQPGAPPGPARPAPGPAGATSRQPGTSDRPPPRPVALGRGPLPTGAQPPVPRGRAPTVTPGAAPGAVPPTQ